MELTETLKEKLPSAQIETSPFGEIKVKVPAGDYLAAAKEMAGLGFAHLSSLTAVDHQDRLEIISHVYKMESRAPQVSLRADLPRENPKVATLTGVWPTAEWHEREAFDMFGIVFEGHPDLRRILLPENWPGGYPLLKDFVDQRHQRPVQTEPAEGGEVQ